MLAVLPQVALGDRNFPDRVGLDVEELEITFQLGLGVAAVVDLNDVRLISVVTEQIEPMLKAVRIEQVAEDHGQAPALAAMDKALRRPGPGRSRVPCGSSFSKNLSSDKIRALPRVSGKSATTSPAKATTATRSRSASAM